MASSVYWIHHPEHTDMFSQGYIGVSKDVTKRWNKHRKHQENKHFANAVELYGWDFLVKKQILIAEENYCLDIEQKLRSTKNVGWNIAVGGGKPPVNRWNKGLSMSEETRQKVSQKKLGSIPWNKYKEGMLPSSWNKGLKTPDNVCKKQSLAKLGRPSHRKGTKHTPESIAKMKANRPRTVLSEAGRQAIINANTGRKHELTTCPYCGKIGGITAMPRWHFENCKEK
jgi:predicted GIY-YIG superfamily endonuclease